MHRLAFRVIATMVLAGALLAPSGFANRSTDSEAAPPRPSDKRCEGITKAGAQCKRNAQSGKRFCYQHVGQEKK
jgi:hypothetical protein